MPEETTQNMSFGTLRQVTIGKRNREEAKQPAKPGTTESITARVAQLIEIGKKGDQS